MPPTLTLSGGLCYTAPGPWAAGPGGQGMSRVLQINDFSTGGGAEVVMARTTQLLRRAGWHVDVFTAADLADRRLSPRRYITNRVACRALAARLADFDPDVVHLHNYYHLLSPGILATLQVHKRRRPLRVVMTAHDSHLVCPDAGGTWFRGWSSVRHPVAGERLRRWPYLLSRRWDHRGLGHSLLKLVQHVWNYRLGDLRKVLDVVLCPSRFLQRLCAAAGQASAFLPYPTPPAPRGPLLRPGPLRLVFVGRLEPEKGVHDFLRILPATFTGTFAIIGSGRDADRCRALCQRRGLEKMVTFRGRLPHDQVLELLGQFHVLVLPSLFLENSPLSLHEALAAGTNLLVSDRGGSPEIVADSGVGHVFTPGDVGSLATQLERIAYLQRQGMLNRFDASAFLDGRSEGAYLRRLLPIYEGTSEGRAAA
jgi:glycosyltransferase involved in cell wall biosynthesis